MKRRHVMTDNSPGSPHSRITAAEARRRTRLAKRQNATDGRWEAQERNERLRKKAEMFYRQHCLPEILRAIQHGDSSATVLLGEYGGWNHEYGKIADALPLVIAMLREDEFAVKQRSTTSDDWDEPTYCHLDIAW